MPHLRVRVLSSVIATASLVLPIVVGLSVESDAPAKNSTPPAAPAGIAGLLLTLENEKHVCEHVRLPNQPELTAYVLYSKSIRKRKPVILSLVGAVGDPIVEEIKKALAAGKTSASVKLPLVGPAYEELVDRGCMVVAFTPRPIPWLEGKARWVWPTPDQAAVETFARTAEVAPGDFGLVIDYLETRDDVRADRIGYFGFSAAAMAGVAIIPKEPRITCAVLSGGSGNIAGLAEAWRRTGIWRSPEPHNWPETDARIAKHDPIRNADKFYPRAILMLNGGKDPIVPVEANNAFFEALYPHYAHDPDRLQYIVFEGAGHGWDPKWWSYLQNDWFDRYLIQEKPPEAKPRK